MYRSIGFDDPGMEDTNNNNDATEDNYIPIDDALFVQHRNSI